MTRFCIGIFVLALLGAPAFGEPATPGFASLDMNEDGTVNLAEFATLYPIDSALAFEMLDRDGDGRLTADEYEQMTPRLTVAHR
jgi:Ca2+-binding EF-hand superfamily protein